MLIQEKDYLEIYKKQKEADLGWGDCSTWTNQDFEKLSELIFEKTAVRLSESTLKRVWGKVKYDSIPTVTTLNTLAQFSGHENWRSFKAANGFKNGNGHDHADEHPDIIIKRPEVISSVSEKNNARRRLVLAGITGITVLLLAILILNINLTAPPEKVDLSQVLFDFKIVSNELPNSVVFNYEVGDNKIDTLKIQQSWDPQKQALVSPAKHQHTSIYYYPGFFVAKLIADNVILKEQDIFIKTDGWKGIIEQSPVPTYLSKAEINLNQNRMSIEQGILTAKTSKTVFNGIWTNFYNVGNFDTISSDDFDFEATLQNTSTPEESVCRQTKITILTTKSAITLPLSAKGCSSALSVYNGEELISGKDTDLSMFGCDFSVPQILSCEMRNKEMIIYLNKSPIFKSLHKSDLGRIVGLIISFEGTGRISDVDLGLKK